MLRLPLAFCLALGLAPGAKGHIDAVTRQDYSGYERNDGKGSCCDWHDCRPALPPFLTPDGEKIADRARNTYPFDPAKIVRRPSDDGNWHVCGTAKKLFCIIAPAEARLWDMQKAPAGAEASKLMREATPHS